jgi:hypothetical protein
VSGWIVFGAAALLTIERLCYVWVWHCPDAFRELCAKVAAVVEEALELVRDMLLGGLTTGPTTVTSIWGPGESQGRSGGGLPFRLPIADWPSRPVYALRYLFYGFKVLQIAVFVGWCYVFGNGSVWPPDAGPWAIAIGGAFAAFGQLLNASVFYQLGTTGVFYGNKFGYHVSWCQRFPFTLFEHPQYFGTLLSIWGFFLILRFPHDDWIVLPAIETVYYIVGAHLER